MMKTKNRLIYAGVTGALLIASVLLLPISPYAGGPGSPDFPDLGALAEMFGGGPSWMDADGGDDGGSPWGGGGDGDGSDGGSGEPGSGDEDGVSTQPVIIDDTPQIVPIQPRDRELISTTHPIVRVRFVDPSGSSPINPSSISATLDNGSLSGQAITSYDTESQRYTMTFTSPLTQGRHEIAIDAENFDGKPAETKIIRLDVLIKTLDPGLHMISVPYELLGHKANSTFVVGETNPNIARWGVFDLQNNGFGYHKYYDANTATEFVSSFKPGRSYWIKTDTPISLRLEGGGLDRNNPYLIQNERDWDSTRSADVGWQMVGNPFPFPIPMGGMMVIGDGESRILSFDKAAEKGFISPVLFHWESSTSNYGFQRSPNLVLEPYRGYWIYKSKPCRLVVLPFNPSRNRLGLNEGSSDRPLALQIDHRLKFHMLPNRFSVNPTLIFSRSSRSKVPLNHSLGVLF